MKVLVAIDSFKSSLSSIEAGSVVKEAAIEVFDNAKVILKAIADGGEGTLEAIVDSNNGSYVSKYVCGPSGEKVKALYGILPDGRCVIEIASTAGLMLLDESKRDPLFTTTYGVGELIADAISRGCRNFIIGLGGSATNDGGMGMLSALGFEFLDKDGKHIELCGKGLEDLCSIKNSGVIKELSKCSFTVACDVKNPLCGKNGCSYIFAPQKGATPDTVKKMDNWLYNYAKLIKEIYPHADPDSEGAGAAGGLGFAFTSCLNGKLERGIDIVISQTMLEEDIKNSNLVITGEGRLDSQTVMGKAPQGIAVIAKKYNLPVIAFCGCSGADAELCNDYGIDAFFPIVSEAATLEQCLEKKYAEQNLFKTAKQVFKLIKISNNIKQ